MRRFHLFEFEDQAWFPAAWRSFGTDILQFSQTAVDQSETLAEPLAEFASRTASPRFIDLCSGSSGPWLNLAAHLTSRGCELPIVLTDLFPNPSATERIVAGSGGRISQYPEPVDATRIPNELVGLRTLFNGFHHFRPEQAKAILQAAVDAGQPIAVAEFVARSPLAMLGVLLAGLVVTPLATPFVRPFRWTRLVFTYLLPVVPLLVIWDGLVSCLRIYTPAELEELVADLDAPGWTFEATRVANASGPIPITLLLGRPPEMTHVGEASRDELDAPAGEK